MNTWENIRFQIKNIDKEFETLSNLIQTNSTQNTGEQIYNLSLQLLNIAVQLINTGNQFPVDANKILPTKTQILNYGMMLQNLSFQINNSNNMNNNIFSLNNMGMQINSNINPNNNINNNQNSLSFIQQEFKSCCEDSYLNCAGTKFELQDNNPYIWILTIQGPLGTPYEDGFFKIKISFPKDYPQHGADIKFINKICHINVDWQNDPGRICYPILNEWKAIGKVKGKISYSIKEAIYDLIAFLYKPHDCTHDEKLYELYTKNREKFDEEARKWTKQFASEVPPGFIKRKNYPYC